MRLMYLAGRDWLDTVKRSLPEKRLVRIEKLRALIQMDTYNIDSITLARCILVSQVPHV